MAERGADLQRTKVVPKPTALSPFTHILRNPESKQNRRWQLHRSEFKLSKSIHEPWGWHGKKAYVWLQWGWSSRGIPSLRKHRRGFRSDLWPSQMVACRSPVIRTYLHSRTAVSWGNFEHPSQWWRLQWNVNSALMDGCLECSKIF